MSQRSEGHFHLGNRRRHRRCLGPLGCNWATSTTAVGLIGKESRGLTPKMKNGSCWPPCAQVLSPPTTPSWSDLRQPSALAAIMGSHYSYYTIMNLSLVPNHHSPCYQNHYSTAPHHLIHPDLIQCIMRTHPFILA